jgi:hypothetical protein
VVSLLKFSPLSYNSQSITVVHSLRNVHIEQHFRKVVPQSTQFTRIISTSTTNKIPQISGKNGNTSETTGITTTQPQRITMLVGVVQWHRRY